MSVFGLFNIASAHFPWCGPLITRACYGWGGFALTNHRVSRAGFSSVSPPLWAALLSRISWVTLSATPTGSSKRSLHRHHMHFVWHPSHSLTPYALRLRIPLILWHAVGFFIPVRHDQVRSEPLEPALTTNQSMAGVPPCIAFDSMLGPSLGASRDARSPLLLRPDSSAQV